MSFRRIPVRSLGALAASLMGGLVVASAAGAQSGAAVLAIQAAPSGVTAYRDLAVWRAWDPGSRTYRLAASEGGGPAFVLRASPRRVPFDVDLGPDRDGSPVAVFSRCEREPPYSSSIELPGPAR
ncbi:MAG: hypothetical protein ACRDPW_08985 [Mycobacteriales bacterium]